MVKTNDAQYSFHVETVITRAISPLTFNSILISFLGSLPIGAIVLMLTKFVNSGKMNIAFLMAFLAALIECIHGFLAFFFFPD
ncbi:MAG: hypothetical protein SNJ77_12865, partial [Cytophagales bacterium]